MTRPSGSVAAAVVTILATLSCSSGVDAVDRSPPDDPGIPSASTSPATSTVPPTSGGGGPSTTPGPGSSAVEAPETSQVSPRPGSTGAGFPSDWTPDPLVWSDCAGLDCTTLTVPIDWDRPDGPTIDLALNRNPTSGSRKGAILTNPGGPGAPGTDFVASGALADIVQGRDIIGWDPRGTGGSAVITCTGDPIPFLHLDSDPDTPTEQANLDDAARAVAGGCEGADQDLLAHLTALDVARDMEAIRRALGEDRLDFYGFSYGTLLGLLYAELFPDRVGHLVLDGVVDPSHDLPDLLRAQTVAFDQRLTEALDSCGGQQDCALADPEAAWDRLAAQVESEPLAGEEATLGPAELAVAAVSSSYRPGGAAALIDALVAADRGDPEPMLALADEYYSLLDYAPYAAITCVDQPHPHTPAEWRSFADELEALSPRVGGSVANELLPCASWPVPPQRTPAEVRAEGSPPILVIGTTRDAATPLDQAVKIAGNLENGHLLVVDQEGHTSYGNSCAAEAVTAYLDEDRLPADGARC